MRIASVYICSHAVIRSLEVWWLFIQVDNLVCMIREDWMCDKMICHQDRLMLDRYQSYPGEVGTHVSIYNYPRLFLFRFFFFLVSLALFILEERRVCIDWIRY